MRSTDDLIRQITDTTGPEGCLVLGMGQTGLSLARWLHARGLSFRALDSRVEPPQWQAIQDLAGNGEVQAGAWPAAWFEAARVLFVSPGVPLADPMVDACRARGVPIISDIELFARASDRPLVAVTGSNGKSTVVTLLTLAARAAGVRAEAGGNIGTPALDLLDKPRDLDILELSSFQLEMIAQLQARVAMLLNLSPDHQDRYPDMDAYRAAKQKVFDGCQAAVVNADDTETWPQQNTDCRWIRYSRENTGAADLSLQTAPGRTEVLRNGVTLWRGPELKLKGQHNELNVLAVFATAVELGWDTAAVGRAVAEFRGLPHRCEWVAEWGGVTFINDSKGTNVGATLAAVEGLRAQCTGTLRLLLGGDAKGAAFDSLAAVLGAARAETVCFGRDADRISTAMRDAGVPVVRCQTLQDALDQAWSDAAEGDWILLSPACASLDQFADYRSRGEAFVAAIHDLVLPMDASLTGAPGGGS